ncbi:twin-arginine translocation signal domain-containing protein, partial [Halorubrum sp. SS5]
MPSFSRRSLLKAVGVTGASVSVVGCSKLGPTGSPQTPPAGSLLLRNRHSVPHEIALEVLDVGTAVTRRVEEHDTVTGTPDAAVPERDLTVTAVLEPGQTRTYESVFVSEVWYDIRFTLDGEYPGEDLARTVYKPVRRNAETAGRKLIGRVSDGGGFSWGVS